MFIRRTAVLHPDHEEWSTAVRPFP